MLVFVATYVARLDFSEEVLECFAGMMFVDAHHPQSTKGDKDFVGVQPVHNAKSPHNPFKRESNLPKYRAVAPVKLSRKGMPIFCSPNKNSVGR